MPLDRGVIGRNYLQSEALEVSAEAAASFWEATGATAPVDEAVHPLWIATRVAGGMTAPLLDASLGIDLMRVGLSELEFHLCLPIRVGDALQVESTVTAIVETPAGEMMYIDTSCRDARREPVARLRHGVFVRAARKKVWDAVSASERAIEAARFAAHPEGHAHTFAVAPDQSQRFAVAAGDPNPIYTDDEVARMAGLPQLILQPLCVLAIAHNLLCASAARPPLRSLTARFAAPVRLTDTLTLCCRGMDDLGTWFEMINQDHLPVLAAGRAEWHP